MTVNPRAASLAAVAVLVLAACGGNDTGESTTDLNRSIASTPRGDNPVDVELVDNKFVPDKLTAEAGDTIVVNLKNSGQAPHTFTIKEFAINEEVKPGNTNKKTFTAAKAGEFKIVCTYHESVGMVATLTAS